MVAITATTNSSPSLQMTLMRSRLEQARREADQAETQAKDLRAQAQQAEREAQQGNETVRRISTELNQQAATYASPRRSSASAVPAKTQDFLERLYKATSQKFAAEGNALKTDSNAQPVINIQGQSTGRIVNIQA